MRFWLTQSPLAPRLLEAASVTSELNFAACGLPAFKRTPNACPEAMQTAEQGSSLAEGEVPGSVSLDMASVLALRPFIGFLVKPQDHKPVRATSRTRESVRKMRNMGPVVNMCAQE